MDTYLLDWANLLLRWAHVITAIAWVGSSFYFVFLDSSLVPPADDKLRGEGATGELWAVHGGGFYHPVKYAVAPPQLPPHLHWFYWESYSTWLTGFGLFTVLYLWHAGSFLVDRNLLDWPPAAAGAAAVASLYVFWAIYNQACKWFGEKDNGDAIVGAIVLVLVVAASWAACRVFPGRAAFVIVGAMLATAMSANVLFWIIPGQRQVVAAIRAGQPVDPVHGFRGKQRSVHNTYFTLPVLVAMLSNHYGFLWSHPHNWLVLVLMMAAGAAIRQFFVLRHGFKLGRNGHPWPYAVAGVVVIAAVAAWLAPAPAPQQAAQKPVGYADVQPVIAQRCVQCHGEQLQMKGIRLDSAESLKQHAQQVYQQAVVQKTMPLNNATGMTEEERALVARWFSSSGSSN
ncbi:urate hydroxylase PuuD [Ramlibacter sp. PS4R-6]|uniref:urate hydroxylase PuuD n=1 Tax=Ramlibacter sp. PS4R-6 TaxID=3133438 RepID=UPI0030A27F5F